MTDRATLLALADRVEAAQSDERGRLIGEAWDMSCISSKAFMSFACAKISAFDTNAGTFARLLDAHAYVDAAMMLVPHAGKWSVTAAHKDDWQACVWDGDAGSMEWRTAASPALALCAAALRARAEAGE